MAQGTEAGSSLGAVRQPCDLCGEKSFQPLSRRDRRGRALRTVVCRECGLVRHWHVPTDQQLRDFYSRRYRQDYHGEDKPSARRIMRAWQNGQRIYRLLTHYIAPGTNVFEVGAGIGCTVKYFAEMGFRASGIEPHQGFQEFAANTLNADVSNCELVDCSSSRNIDLMLLVHVIEHLRSPSESLVRMARMLKTGGLLYIECPNLAAPFTLPSRMFHFAHIHNFTPCTLEAMAAQAGLKRVTWMYPSDDPNLAGLFCKTSQPVCATWQHGYETTIDAFHRYRWSSYHLRPQYLRARFRKIAGYLRERFAARQFVAKLIHRCSTNVPVGAARTQQAA